MIFVLQNCIHTGTFSFNISPFLSLSLSLFLSLLEYIFSLYFYYKYNGCVLVLAFDFIRLYMCVDVDVVLVVVCILSYVKYVSIKFIFMCPMQNLSWFFQYSGNSFICYSLINSFFVSLRNSEKLWLFYCLFLILFFLTALKSICNLVYKFLVIVEFMIILPDFMA